MDRRKQEDELKQVMQQEKNLERIKVRVVNVLYSICVSTILYCYGL